MRKKELLKIGPLYATPDMMQRANADIPKRTVYPGWSEKYVSISYQYGLYLRCQVVDGVLNVAFFFPEHMRTGGEKPAYELYIDREEGAFLTYDRIAEKWLTAKLDRIPWPGYVFRSEKKWVSPQEDDRIRDYLGGKEGGYLGLLKYQLKIRADELKRRHKKETDPWNLDLAQTPDLPKDWDRWVSKVGIVENYIFYQYSRKREKTGYCTFCEKEVAVRAPRHNKTGYCPRCRHRITYKSIGKAGTVVTENSYMYLMKRCKDGFMIRVFKGCRKYPKGDYRNPECNSWEVRRVIYDHHAHPRNAYYWGLYKQSELRWIRTGFCSPNWYGDESGRVYGKTLPARRLLIETEGCHTDRDRKSVV